MDDIPVTSVSAKLSHLEGEGKASQVSVAGRAAISQAGEARNQACGGQALGKEAAAAFSDCISEAGNNSSCSLLTFFDRPYVVTSVLQCVQFCVSFSLHIGINVTFRP